MPRLVPQASARFLEFWAEELLEFRADKLLERRAVQLLEHLATPVRVPRMSDVRNTDVRLPEQHIPTFGSHDAWLAAGGRAPHSQSCI